jgi:hypothetical protein
MIRMPNLRVSIVLIPKTGTTSVKNYILNNCINCLEHPRTHITKNQSIDEKFSSADDRFIAVVRDPLELQLSRYFYRSRTGKIEDHSPEDFKKRLKKGEGLLTGGEYYELAPQHWFVDDIDWLVPFPEMETFYSKFIEICGFSERQPFKILNSSNSIATRALMIYYYDAETKELAEHYHRQDIELYKKALDNERL